MLKRIGILKFYRHSLYSIHSTECRSTVIVTLAIAYDLHRDA